MADTGRPRLYDDPEALAAKVEDYFDHIEQTGKMPTLSGLCLFLGFSDKQSFSRYETYGERFSLTVNKARLRIEDDRNQRLAKADFSPGIIFDLKNNHGWKDKTEHELSGADGGPIRTEARIDTSNLTDDQLRALASIPVQPR